MPPTEPTEKMVAAFQQAWEATPKGEPGDRTRAGLQAAMGVIGPGLVAIEHLQLFGVPVPDLLADVRAQRDKAEQVGYLPQWVHQNPAFAALLRAAGNA